MPVEDRPIPGAEGLEGMKIKPTPAPEEIRGRGARPVLFVVLFAFWIIFSGRFDALHLVLGLISCAIVTLFSGDLIPELQAHSIPRAWLRFVSYIPWLLGQILLANLRILVIVFHPRMMDRIDPHIVRFRSHLKSPVSLVAFANSITLTPGTITISVKPDGEFKVHAIDKVSGDALPGDMETRVNRAFGGI
jgi:multicomponent Na+:H+ antiporter subunit E